MDSCSALPPNAGFISSITSFVDCQAQILGSGAYQALSMPGSTLSIVLTGFLTIFIAIIGYNLLLGTGPTVRSGTLAFVKIGAVLALATSWPAYRTLVYDLVIDGPAQLVGEVGPSIGVVGSDGTLIQRLDLTDRGLAQLAILGPGNPAPGTELNVPPAPFGGFDAFALGGARMIFLLTAIAGLAAVRIIAGLALALGPFFIAFLLFDNTRSLFEGWVRVLAGAMLATVGVAITLGLELALVEPWLSNILARRMAGEALPTVSVELLVMMSLFAIVVVVAMAGSARLARAFRLAPLMQLIPVMNEPDRGVAGPSARTAGNRDVAASERTRAAAVAGMLAPTSRRDFSMAAQESSVLTGARQTPAINANYAEPSRTTVPVGRTFTRRSSSRFSASANRRDGGA